MPSRTDQLEERTFALAVRSLADALALGSDASPFRGSGGEYVQSRGYLPGDPIRAMDWRVTARTGRPHVKEYESLKHKPVVLVVDQSRSMFIASTRPTKWQWASALAGALGLAAIARSSAASLFGTGRDSPTLRGRPTMARGEVLERAAHLRHLAPARQASLADTLRDVDVAAREASLLLVLSDLHEPDAVPALRRAAARHEVVVMRLQDPAEVAAPPRGFFRGRHAESDATFLSRPGKRLAPSASDAAATLRKAAVAMTTLRTETDFVPLLREFLAQRGSLS